MESVKWGIIGCGDVTEVKSGPALQKADRSSLVAVMRRNGMLAADYAKRHHVPNHYDDAGQLINDPSVNAVYVATPPSTHKKYTLMALAAGKPVYVEKPMALNHAECQEMLDAATQAKLPLFVAYYRRTLPRFLKIKALIESGAIGEVRLVSVTLYRPALPQESDPATRGWRLNSEISGGGYFVDLASHIFDLLDFFFGPIAQVSGFASNQAGNYTAEDIVTGSFLFNSGLQGTGSFSFSAFEQEDKTEIIGSKGKICYDTFGNGPIILKTAESETEFNFPDVPHIQQPLIQTVVDELTGNGRCPSHGISAARTNWVIDQLLASFKPTSYFNS